MRRGGAPLGAILLDHGKDHLPPARRADPPGVAGGKVTVGFAQRDLGVIDKDTEAGLLLIHLAPPPSDRSVQGMVELRPYIIL